MLLDGEQRTKKILMMLKEERKCVVIIIGALFLLDAHELHAYIHISSPVCIGIVHYMKGSGP